MFVKTEKKMRTNIFKKIGQYFANLTGGKHKSKTDLYETPEQLLADIEKLPHFSSVENNENDKLNFYVDLLSIISRGAFVEFKDAKTKKYSPLLFDEFRDSLRDALRAKGLKSTELSGVALGKIVSLTGKARLEVVDQTRPEKYADVDQFTYPKALVNNVLDADKFGYIWEIATGSWTDTWLQANAPELGAKIHTNKVEARDRFFAEYEKNIGLK